MAVPGELRAADTDRQATADWLRAAVGEGRLDLDEYDRRLRSAYAAISYADLDRLTADLPAPAPAPLPPLPVPAPAAAARRVAWIAGCPPAGCLVLLVLLIVAMLAGD